MVTEMIIQRDLFLHST